MYLINTQHFSTGYLRKQIFSELFGKKKKCIFSKIIEGKPGFAKDTFSLECGSVVTQKVSINFYL